MAPNTRSVVVPSNNGASGSGNNNTIDETMKQAIGEIIDEKLVSIQQALTELSSQVLGISLLNHQMGNGNRGNQSHSRMAKIEFPKFSGEDVKGWVFRCEQFFVLDQVTDAEKEVVLARFGSVFEDPMAELKNLKYETSAKIYEDAFDNLLSRVEISEDHDISLFIGGLPTEIEMRVRMFKPRTLTDAYCLTNLQEATLNALKKKNRIVFNGGSSTSIRFNAQGTTLSKPLLPLPQASSVQAPKTNRKQLTQKEYQEKRANNLCFYFDQKYTPSHKCSGKMYSLKVLAIEDDETQDMECLGEENFEEIEEMPQISLNAINEMVLGIQWLSTLGDIKCNFEDLRMEFVYKNKTMVLRGTPKSNLELMHTNKQNKMERQSMQPEFSSMQLCVFPCAE
ncbi:hypothetical protein Tco_0642676 [Tanacetum coccineum]